MNVALVAQIALCDIMALLSALASTSRTLPSAASPARAALSALPAHGQTQQTRAVSSSPYGRTHVWKRRAPKLPNPMVPVFPQRLVRVDGSTVVHLTTSPRSVIRLTRDTTNHPTWNATRFVHMEEEEDEFSGRVGRFTRKFKELSEDGGRKGMTWLEEAGGELGADHVVVVKDKPKGGKSK